MCDDPHKTRAKKKSHKSSAFTLLDSPVICLSFSKAKPLQDALLCRLYHVFLQYFNSSVCAPSSCCSQQPSSVNHNPLPVQAISLSQVRRYWGGVSLLLAPRGRGCPSSIHQGPTHHSLPLIITKYTTYRWSRVHRITYMLRTA